jgi:hypothetical protein
MRGNMDVDRKRIAAVRKLERLGYRYREGERVLPAGASPSRQLADADSMQGMLMRRDDALAGCTNSGEHHMRCGEITASRRCLKHGTHDAIEAYEAKRWPLGGDPSVPGGKVDLRARRRTKADATLMEQWWPSYLRNTNALGRCRCEMTFRTPTRGDRRRSRCSIEFRPMQL